MTVEHPPHPGAVVRRQCLEPLGLSVLESARGLGVTRQALSALVNEKNGVSIEMAVRLSKAFGSDVEHWLRLQAAYDAWASKPLAERIQVKPFPAP